MELLDFFVVSKKIMVTWQGSHLLIKNVSTFALDIHKSKLTVQELQDLRLLVVYFSLVFFGKILFTIVCMDGKVKQKLCLQLLVVYFSLVFFGKILFTIVCMDGKVKWKLCLQIKLLKNGASIKDNGTS